MALFPNEHETIEGVGRALRSGQTTCAQVLERCFDRIAEWEPRVKAWVRVDRAGAIEQARARDDELARGTCRGPLHGIPLGIKDIIDVGGLPTGAGFSPWRDRVARSDAPLVRQLREAGAVILGKTVTTQFAWIDPPPTRNPWNLERTPGGSSSGSAAAVALGMCLGAIGTQTGGSIIRPASFCGVCGFKPSHGAVRTEGVVPFAHSLDHPGPIARSVRDLRALYDAIRNDAVETLSLNSSEEIEKPCNDRLSALSRPPRLARLRGFFDNCAETTATAALEHALQVLAGAGAKVQDVPAEFCTADGLDFPAIVRHHRTIMSVEAAAVHEARFAQHRGDYAPRITALVEEGLGTPPRNVQQARADLLEKRRALAASLVRANVGDALVMPATLGPAPDLSTTGDPAFNSPWSYLGWPSVSLPVSLTPDGMPLAMQLVAPGAGRDREKTLLKTASWCEDVLRHVSRPAVRSD